MSNFNPLDRAKIAVHRSSFDLSSKKLFTAKVGEILPVYWQIAIPGTKYRISSDWFTRTVPVNTAAYTRIKEYYDFYAVPLRLISRALPQAFTQMSDYMTSAVSSNENTPMLTQVPYVTQAVLSTYLQTANANDQTNTRDDAGLPLVYGSCKLLDMLGYGSMIATSNTGKAAITQKYLGLDSLSDGINPLVYQQSQAVNALPFLAYQKVYFDFFSNSQWEKHLAYAYNVDYWTGGSSIALCTDMLKLRYANYPKDYFMGMLPASQYGSVAVLSPVSSVADSRSIVNDNLSMVGGTLRSQIGSATPVLSAASTVSTNLRLNADLSALSIRATEYLQRWKEIVQFSSKDYSDQMAAQFGVKAPEYMGNHAHFIGGWSSVININEVVNTNLDTDESQASIAGKGVSSNSGHTLTYDCGAEHQVIICVYHSVPLLDWDLTGQAPQLTVTSISDFPQPAFDQLGMQVVPALNLQNNPGLKIVAGNSLGYNLRYWQWKSNIDTVHAGFRKGTAYQAWAAPLNGYQVLTGSGAWSYLSMKIRPQQLNSIFVPQIDAANCSVAFDQLLCNVNFQVYAVQNLDRNGLPY